MISDTGSVSERSFVCITKEFLYYILQKRIYTPFLVETIQIIYLTFIVIMMQIQCIIILVETVPRTILIIFLPFVRNSTNAH